MSTALQSQPQTEHGEHAHPPHLAHHFDTPTQQYEAAVQGMWLFLGTEVLLFSGLFCAYAVYRSLHPEIFEYAHQFLSVKWGAINTVVLLVSSFTMAAGVWAAQGGMNRLCGILLALTVGCGFAFLGIKYVEYEHKWKEGLLWGKHYSPQVHGHAFPAHAAEEHSGVKPAASVTPGQAPAEHRLSSDFPHQSATEHAAAVAAVRSDPNQARAGAPTTLPSGNKEVPYPGDERRSPAEIAAAAAKDANAPGAAATAPAGAAQAAGSDQPSWAFTAAESGPRGLLLPAGGPSEAGHGSAAEPAVRNVHTFFGVYFAMTGLHGLHVIAGMVVISWVMVRAFLGHFSPAYSTPVHMVGLYWHVVDLIWIYLFPLLYLIH